MLTHDLLDLLCSQLLQVTLVAAVVGVTTRLIARDRPHLAHALWALVLLKCVTPPVIASPTGIFSWVTFNHAEAAKDVRVQATSPQVKDQPHLLDTVASSDLTYRYYVPLPDSTASESGSLSLRDNFRATLLHLSQFAINNRMVSFWLLGCLGVATVLSVRLLVFLRKVKRLRRSTPSHLVPLNCKLERLSKSLSIQLKLRRSVGVAVLDAGIGPAIVGLLRPCILLPKAVVLRASSSELKALLAHELVHFRRGDLWWSTIQAMSLSIAWCNPLIWLASRKLSLESERCCDEETVTSLGIEPAEYARCLITVLEKKHTLRAAPLLPGVRPVDVTANRLERIMRFGQGSQSRCPSWVTVVLLIGAAAILPGTASTSAQENSQESTPLAETKVQPANPPNQVGGNASIKAFIDSDNLAQLGYEFKTYPAQRALEKLVAEGCKPQVAIAKLQTMLPRGTHWTSSQSTTKHGLTIEFIDGATGKAMTLGGKKPAIVVTQEAVFALGTKADHEHVQATLRRIENHGVAQLRYQIRIIEAPTAKVRALTDSWQSVGKVTEGVVAASYTVDAKEVFETKTSQALSECEIKELIDSGDVLSAPTIMGHSGSNVELRMGGEVPYVSGFKPLVDEDGKKSQTMQPIVGLVQTGLTLKLKGALSENKDQIELALDYTQAELKGMDTFTFDSENGGMTVQQPILAQTQVITNRKFPINKTVAICGGAKAREVVSEQRVPILSKVPYVSRLFKSKSIAREMISTIILVECTELSAETTDVHAATYASPAEAQAADTETLVDEPVKTALPGKPLPPLPSMKKPAPSPEDSATSQRNERFKVFGPVQPQNAKDSAPPADAEVFRVIDQHTDFEQRVDEKYQINKVKIADYVDPPRFVPLLGPAALHHAHYKCSLTNSTGEVVEVVYIDHQHYQMQQAQSQPALAPAQAEVPAAIDAKISVDPKTGKRVLGGEVSSDLGMIGKLILDEVNEPSQEKVFSFYMGVTR